MHRICFFAHYDAQCEIKDYVTFYIKELTSVCDDIIFISVSNVPDDQKLKISGYVKSFINRENKGYDFGSWKAGIESIGYNNLSQYDEVILCNDSCFGPIVSFDDIFAKMENIKTDAWSITATNNPIFHMNSYFMLFKKNIFTNKVFSDFFTRIEDQPNKIDYILKYEVGISRVLKDNGFRVSCYNKLPLYLYIPHIIKFLIVRMYKRLFDIKYKAWIGSFGKCNKIFKKSIFSAFKCLNITLFPHKKYLPPLIKTMLFRDNPYGINTDAIKKAITDKSKYNLDLIDFIRSKK